MNDASPASGGGRSVSLCIAGVAALAAAGTHLGALSNDVALDDATIAAHPAIQSLSALPAALASPWWYETGRLYRPLALVSLGIDRALGGGVLLSHATNIVLHSAVSALVACLCLRWLSPLSALAGALLVAVLPVHAEAVSTIVGRAELISALGLVGLMLLVTRREGPSPRASLGAALLAGVALGGKESGAAAPLLALLAARAVAHQRPHARRWALAALSGTLVLLLARVLVLGTLGGDLPHPFYRGMAPSTRIGVALSLLPRTAAMLLLPVTPAIEEVPPLASALKPDPLMIVVGIALLVFVIACIVRHARSPSALGLGALVLASTIAPTSNLLFAEGALTARTLYAPSIGAAMLAAALLHRARGARVGAIAFGGVAATCAFAAAATWRETRVWHDTPSVARTMVARRPTNYRGHEFLAYAARDAGRLDESVRHFGHAIALFPRDAELLTDAGTVAIRVADTVIATRWLEAAVAATPRAARARTRLYGLARGRGDDRHARALLVEGLRHEPEQRTWIALLERRPEATTKGSIRPAVTPAAIGPRQPAHASRGVAVGDPAVVADDARGETRTPTP